MTPTPAELRAKIVDPEGPLYTEFLQPWGAGDDESVDAVLNLIRDGEAYLQWKVLTRSDMLKAVNATGAIAALKAMSLNDGHRLQSTAYNLLVMLNDSTSEWDMNDPMVRGLIVVLDLIHPVGMDPFGDPTPGLGTAVASISRRPGSYAEKEFGRGYRSTAADVAAARKAGS